MTTNLLTSNKVKRKQFALLRPKVVSSKAEILASLSKADKNTLWISGDQKTLVELLRLVPSSKKHLGKIILLHKPNRELLPVLWTWFDAIAFAFDGGFLPSEELAAALAAQNRRDLFVGGSVDSASATLTLWRGDLCSLVVPLSAFPPSGDGINAKFDKFSVADYGHTIRLGEYEAASDAILYEFDADYRRRQAKERIASEKGLGASIRRLRKQRGLRREDFAPLSSKTIARIEQGRVNSIHGKTQATIAKALGITADKLKSY